MSRAYLATPLMVGSRRVARRVSARCCAKRCAAAVAAVLVEADAGLGRSRLLDAFALEAKLLGAVALRAGASSAQAEPLAIARSLARAADRSLARDSALGRAPRRRGRYRIRGRRPMPVPLPRAMLRRLRGSRCAPSRAARPRASSSSTCSCSGCCGSRRKHSLCIVVDDVDRVDEPSAALLAALALSAAHKRLLLVASCEPRARSDDAALDLLARECRTLGAAPARPPRDRGAAVLAVRGRAEPGAAERAHPRQRRAAARASAWPWPSTWSRRSAIAYAGGGWTLARALRTERSARARAGRVSRAHRDARCARRCGWHASRRSRCSMASRGPTTRCSIRRRVQAEIDAAVDQLIGRDVLRFDGVRVSRSATARCATPCARR